MIKKVLVAAGVGAAVVMGAPIAQAEPSLHDEELLQTSACFDLALGWDPDELVEFLQRKMPMFSHDKIKGVVRDGLNAGCAG